MGRGGRKYTCSCTSFPECPGNSRRVSPSLPASYNCVATVGLNPCMVFLPGTLQPRYCPSKPFRHCIADHGPPFLAFVLGEQQRPDSARNKTLKLGRNWSMVLRRAWNLISSQSWRIP